MPRFICSVCDKSFEVARRRAGQVSGWIPKYCREHSPSKKKAGKKQASGSKKTVRKGTLSALLSRFFERRDPHGRRGSAKYTEGPGTASSPTGVATPIRTWGVGVVWVLDGEIQLQGYGREDGETTNNRMELTALIEAYTALPEDAEVTVFSDSQLCVNTITTWAPGWERNGWEAGGIASEEPRPGQTAP